MSAKIKYIKDLTDLYFNSFNNIKFFPEGRNNDRNKKQNEILSLHKNEFMIIIFGSLIFKDRKKKLRKKMINNINNDFIKIIKLTSIL